MSNINKRLKELSPYVIGIRFKDSLSVVDTFFKDGWSLPTSSEVGYETIPNKPNYYMLYPTHEDVGVDEMLDYVSYVINVNVERELKIELLQLKIKELKEIFSTSSLESCKTLKFNFSTPLDEDSDGEDFEIPIMTKNKSESKIKEGDKKNIQSDDKVSENDVESNGVDGKKHPSEKKTPSKEEIDRFNNTAKVGNEIIDLPPKKGDKIVVEEFEAPTVVCQCDPNNPDEVCPMCIEY